jgi:hypothetical protein
MSKRRIAVPIFLALAAFAAPASAGAATLAPNKACYGGGDAILLNGTGFTPGAQVTIAANGTPLSPPVASTAQGTILAGLVAPFLTSATERTDTFTATDGANPANVGTTGVHRSILRLAVSPANASPLRVRRFKARGFTTGKTLYRHTLRGKKVRNGRMGKLKGACRTLSVKKRLFRRSARTGTYHVQFDTFRHYSSKRTQRIRFRIRVYRVVKRASSAASGTTGPVREEWTQVR